MKNARSSGLSVVAIVAMLTGCTQFNVGVYDAPRDAAVFDVADEHAPPGMDDAPDLDLAATPDGTLALDAGAGARFGDVAADDAPPDAADAGVVDAPCPSEQWRCGERCVDTNRDVSNCGHCGAVCVGTNGTPSCSSGACALVCNAGFADCDASAANGCEADLNFDEGNCGVCERSCANGGVCAGGTCFVQRSCAAETPGCGLVAITRGTFTMGDSSSSYAQPPQTDVPVGSFALDAYEVTVARFNAYWAARVATPALVMTVRSSPIAYPGERSIDWGPAAQEPVPRSAAFNWSWSAAPHDATPRDAHPMNGVDYWMAQEFCVWDGGRLPTEAEWEYAARGRAVLASALAAGRIYPWGDAALNCGRAQFGGCPGADGGSTRRVGSLPMGDSAGLHDLAGNVLEWTADNYGVYPSCWRPGSRSNPLCDHSATSDRVFRGGSWSSDAQGLRAAARSRDAPAARYSSVGFRCARTTP